MPASEGERTLRPGLEQPPTRLCRGLVEPLDAIAEQHADRIADEKPTQNGASCSLDGPGRWPTYCC
jgi:hypothetical protein